VARAASVHRHPLATALPTNDTEKERAGAGDDMELDSSVAAVAVRGPDDRQREAEQRGSVIDVLDDDDDDDDEKEEEEDDNETDDDGDNGDDDGGSVADQARCTHCSELTSKLAAAHEAIRALQRTSKQTEKRLRRERDMAKSTAKRLHRERDTAQCGLGERARVRSCAKFRMGKTPFDEACQQAQLGGFFSAAESPS